MTIDYGVPCDSRGVTTVCLEVNGRIVDVMYDVCGVETYNPVLAVDYEAGGKWYDVMAGDVVSVSVVMV